jgi:hypothetical protein
VLGCVQVVLRIVPQSLPYLLSIIYHLPFNKLF